MKGDWKYSNKNECFRYATRLWDQKARRALAKATKATESQSLEVLSDDNFEENLVIPQKLRRAASRAPTPRDAVEAAQDPCEATSDDAAAPLMAEDEAGVPDQASSSNVSYRKSVNAGLLQQFHKELRLANERKRQIQEEKMKKEAEIGARKKFLKQRRQVRCERYKNFTQRTRSGQPKMQGLVTALTQKILESSRSS